MLDRVVVDVFNVVDIVLSVFDGVFPESALPECAFVFGFCAMLQTATRSNVVSAMTAEVGFD